MNLLLAVFFGILQGLTEFFPVSSSGHLALFFHWSGIKEADLTFDILVHIATLAAILIYFRQDWIQLIRLVFKRERGDFPKMILPYIVLSMIPAGIIGIFFKDQITWIHEHPFWVGVCLLCTATMLFLGFRLNPEKGKPMDQLNVWIVLAMACGQALAVMPGISRAGTTIMVALFLGMERRAAARFSFLMAVPVIAGAGVLTTIDVIQSQTHITSDQWLHYGTGFAAAMFSGFFALAFLMKLLTGPRFFHFGFYCLALGSIAIITSF